MQTHDSINTHYELLVLNIFLFEPARFERHHEELRPETFFSTAYQDIFNTMRALHAKDLPIDEEILVKTLKKNGKNYESILLEILSHTPFISHLNSYIKELQALHVRREVSRLYTELQHEKIDLKQFTVKINKAQNLYLQEREERPTNQVDFNQLSPYLGSLVQDLMNVNKWPASMVLSTVLAAMAGLIGARAKITNNGIVTLFPVIWSIIVAPSSVSTKSTLFEYTEKCIFDTMRFDLIDNYKTDFKQYKSDLKQYQALPKEDKLREIEPECPALKLLIFANDSTPEAKIKSLLENQNGGVVFHDEMKAELERTNNDPRYKALKTSLFDGRIYHKELVNGGKSILENPVLSEIGLITEQWLIDAVQKNDVASGFMARYLFTYKTRSDFQPLKFRQLEIDCKKYSDVGRFVIDMLGFDRSEPVVFRLDSKAQQYYIDWFDDFSDTAFATESDEEITASYRLSTYVLKFALIIYIFNNAAKKLDIVASNMLDVDIDSIKSAIYIMEIFRDENHKVLNLFSDNKKLNFKIDDVTVKLQKKIRATPDKRLSRSDATNGIRGLDSNKLDELLSQGLFKMEKVDRKTFILEN